MFQTRIRRLAALCVACTGVLAVPTLADVIVLDDGTRLVGDLRTTPAGWEVHQADGTVVPVRREAVRSVQFGKVGAAGDSSEEQSPAVPTTSPAGASSGQGNARNSGGGKPSGDSKTAGDNTNQQKSDVPPPATGPAGEPAVVSEKLQSLRRSVRFSRDVSRIIDRYRRFIEQNEGTALADEAAKDLAVWQDRLDRKLVKIGDDWVTPQARRDQQIAALRLADAARAALADGDTKAARAKLDATLAADPTSASAFYLLGVLAMADEDYPAARKQFDLVLEQIPDHAPTLNNVAVIMYRQKQIGGALTFYDQCLAAAPQTRPLLDNVAEALAALPDDDRKSTQAQKLTKRFTQQDQLLQERLKAAGLFRWGATWVDQETFAKLQTAEKDVSKRLDALAGDFRISSDRIDEIAGEISTGEESMREIESHSYVRAPDGTYVRVPYPSAYYDIKQNLQQVRAEQRALKARLDALRAEAKKVQQDLPLPKYTGQQKMIGEAGVPFVLPKGVKADEVFTPASDAGNPATGPAGAPAVDPASTRPPSTRPASPDKASAGHAPADTTPDGGDVPHPRHEPATQPSPPTPRPLGPIMLRPPATRPATPPPTKLPDTSPNTPTPPTPDLH